MSVPTEGPTEGPTSRPAKEALRELQAAFSKVLGDQNFSYVLANPRLPNCPIVFASTTFYSLTGYSAAEVLGRNCNFLQGERALRLARTIPVQCSLAALPGRPAWPPHLAAQRHGRPGLPAGTGTSRQAVLEIRDALREERPCDVCLLNYRKDRSPFWNCFHLEPIHGGEGSVDYYLGARRGPCWAPSGAAGALGGRLRRQRASPLRLARRHPGRCDARHRGQWAAHGSARAGQRRAHRAGGTPGGGGDRPHGACAQPGAAAAGMRHARPLRGRRQHAGSHALRHDAAPRLLHAGRCGAAQCPDRVCLASVPTDERLL